MKLNPLTKTITEDAISYSTVSVELDRGSRIATINITGPGYCRRLTTWLQHEGLGDQFWPLRLARELDDALLEIRFNELEDGGGAVQVRR